MVRAHTLRSEEQTSDTVTVDLHVHSDESDGYFPPEDLPKLLAREQVLFAALTDHQSTRGLLSFHSSAGKAGITDIPGAEISSDYHGAELHLLAYGMNPENQDFQELLHTLTDTPKAIKAVHAAGGIVCLAHPLQTGWEGSVLEKYLRELSDVGLDGIEAFYKPYTSEQQTFLCDIADRLGLLTCGGSDYHGISQDESSTLGIEMPLQRWKQFSSALGVQGDNGVSFPLTGKESHHFMGKLSWRPLLLRIVLPAVLVIASFILLIFGVLIPTKEASLLDRKREMTSELTNSAWSILADYDREVREGKIDLEEAQQAAVERIRRMRYGYRGLNYFWITDKHPRMIMHPYREDLEGEDLTDFTDPDGNRPFVEFVEKVSTHSSGYVTYVWQWHDDPDRMEPKESYVREFQPWGWIIGTGLYVDDVTQEIEVVTGRMIDLSFLVILGSSVLLFFIGYQNMKSEKRRSKAEADLRDSHERYQTLVEASASGTLLLSDQRCLYANRTLLEMLGYDESEFAFLDIYDIIQGKHTASDIASRVAKGEEIKNPVEVRISRKDGSAFSALLSSTQVSFTGSNGLLVSIQDISGSRGLLAEAERETLIARLQTSQLFLTEPVHNCMIPPVCCGMDDPIAQAVRLMNQHNTEIVLIISDDREPVGTLTDQDIRRRVVSGNLDTRLPVTKVMSAPVTTIEERAPVAEALFLLRKQGIDQAVVLDASGKLSGVLKRTSISQPERYALGALIDQIHRARDLDELSACRDHFSVLISSLISSGFLPQHVCRVISDVSDALTRRIIDLTLEDMASPPVPFAFIALGSEAREEQTLATDQDNALIYADGQADPAAVQSYFLELGTRVCDSLHLLGFSHCRGGTMAKNQRWNQNISSWKKDFSSWIAQPDGKALSQYSIFFDQRLIFGESSLLRELRDHLSKEMQDYPGFLSHLAQSTLSYKPPVGLFGQLVPTSDGDGRGTIFDIKGAMLPIVNFARLYACKHRLAETNTLERLRRLQEIGELSEGTRSAASSSFEHLLRLRLKHQQNMLKLAYNADNRINLQTLPQIEAAILKQACSQIGLLQKRLQLDYQRG